MDNCHPAANRRPELITKRPAGGIRRSETTVRSPKIPTERSTQTTSPALRPTRKTDHRSERGAPLPERADRLRKNRNHRRGKEPTKNRTTRPKRQNNLMGLYSGGDRYDGIGLRPHFSSAIVPRCAAVFFSSSQSARGRRP